MRFREMRRKNLGENSALSKRGSAFCWPNVLPRNVKEESWRGFCLIKTRKHIFPDKYACSILWSAVCWPNALPRNAKEESWRKFFLIKTRKYILLAECACSFFMKRILLAEHPSAKCLGRILAKILPSRSEKGHSARKMHFPAPR